MKNLLFLRRNHKHQSSLMSVVLLSLFILSSVFFAACDKDAPIAADNQSDLEKQDGHHQETIDLEKARFSFQGKLYAKEELQRIVLTILPVL